jgi:hypothetical protein
MASSDSTGSREEESDLPSSGASEEAADADSAPPTAPSPRDDADRGSTADSTEDSRSAPESAPESAAESNAVERPHEIQAKEPRSSSGASSDTSSNASSEINEPAGSPSSPVAARIPEPVSPAEGGQVDEPSVTFEWERVTEADNYELQVARDRAFDELVFEGRVGSSSRFTYSGLPPQEGLTLYWRVRAHIDSIGWTDFGTIGTFVLADWRPAQPNLARSSGSAPAEQAQSSRAEPVLIVFSIVITTVAIGLSIIYMQDLAPDAGDEPTAESTEAAEADTVNLDAFQPRDDGTYRIPISTAMERVVERTGGTWNDDVREQRATNGPNMPGNDPPAEPKGSSSE